jgi:hypothetical protein
VTTPDVFIAVVQGFLGPPHPLDVGEVRIEDAIVSTKYRPAEVRDGEYHRPRWETIVMRGAPLFRDDDQVTTRHENWHSAAAWHHEVVQRLITEAKEAMA